MCSAQCAALQQHRRTSAYSSKGGLRRKRSILPPSAAANLTLTRRMFARSASGKLRINRMASNLLSGFNVARQSSLAPSASLHHALSLAPSATLSSAGSMRLGGMRRMPSNGLGLNRAGSTAIGKRAQKGARVSRRTMLALQVQAMACAHEVSAGVAPAELAEVAAKGLASKERTVFAACAEKFLDEAVKIDDKICDAGADFVNRSPALRSLAARGAEKVLVPGVVMAESACVQGCQ